MYPYKYLKHLFQIGFFSIVSNCFKMTSDPKVAIVAGGAGFIGSHLCRRLLADQYKVLCISFFKKQIKMQVSTT